MYCMCVSPVSTYGVETWTCLYQEERWQNRENSKNSGTGNGRHTAKTLLRRICNRWNNNINEWHPCKMTPINKPQLPWRNDIQRIGGFQWMGMVKNGKIRRRLVFSTELSVGFREWGEGEELYWPAFELNPRGSKACERCTYSGL